MNKKYISQDKRTAIQSVAEVFLYSSFSLPFVFLSDYDNSNILYKRVLRNLVSILPNGRIVRSATKNKFGLFKNGVKMVHNELEEYSKWHVSAIKGGIIHEAGFIDSRSYVHNPMKLCAFSKASNRTEEYHIAIVVYCYVKLFNV